jgi:hypothetical protein
MIFRVLGVAALFLGVLFAVVTLLVLLPFFSTFSTSLLILAAVFGVFAYVFLAVGWQLFHPPARRRGSVEETQDEERWATVSAAVEEQAVEAPAGDAVPEPAVVQEPPVEELLPPVEEPLSGPAGVLAAGSQPIVDIPEATFSGFRPVPRGGAPELGATGESDADATAGNGHAAGHVEYKKSGAPVPERPGSRR